MTRLHIDPDVLDPAMVRRGLQLIQTTSPNFAIMASIDLARRQMVLRGHRLLDDTIDRARRAAARLAAIPGLSVLQREHLAGAAAGLHELDETKLLIGTAGLAIDARDVVARLNRVHGVQPELSGAGHVLYTTTIGNTEADMDRRVAGFAEVVDRAGLRPTGNQSSGLVAALLSERPEMVLTPREAFFANEESASLTGASGRIAAQAITPNPPGIPWSCRGSGSATMSSSFSWRCGDAGNPISASDPTLRFVKVVR